MKGPLKAETAPPFWGSASFAFSRFISTSNSFRSSLSRFCALWRNSYSFGCQCKSATMPSALRMKSRLSYPLHENISLTVKGRLFTDKVSNYRICSYKNSKNEASGKKI